VTERAGRRLLGIFAHPDDESFGSGAMLARYAHAGVDVHVCTVTDGAAGVYDAKFLQASGAASLGELRRKELLCACSALGATLHMLRYRDSGMEGSSDNKHRESLYQADLDEVAGDMVRLICELRPQVVVTHDPTGGYFHPDHIKTNHAVLRAWNWLDDPASLPDGCTPWKPALLYYQVIPCSQLKWGLRLLRLFGRDPRHFGQNRDIDLTAVGVEDDKIQVRLDVGPYLSYKAQASACHESQGGGAPRHFPNFLSRRAQRTDYFVQAYPPDRARHHDLFDGIEAPVAAGSGVG
jgi:LmbE family N-acetylglucosaminyl deacetylase